MTAQDSKPSPLGLHTGETSQKKDITDKELIGINQQSLKDENRVNLKANSMRAYKKKMNLLRSKYKTEQLKIVDGKII